MPEQISYRPEKRPFDDELPNEWDIEEFDMESAVPSIKVKNDVYLIHTSESREDEWTVLLTKLGYNDTMMLAENVSSREMVRTVTRAAHVKSF